VKLEFQQVRNQLLISTIEFEWQPMVTLHWWKYNYRYQE